MTDQSRELLRELKIDLHEQYDDRYWVQRIEEFLAAPEAAPQPIQPTLMGMRVVMNPSVPPDEVWIKDAVTGKELGRIVNLAATDSGGTPHHPAAFINAIADEGTKAEAVQYLQQTWNELCECERRLREAEADARRYRWLKGEHELLWMATDEKNRTVKWMRYIKMPAPNISKETLTDTSVYEELDAAIDAALSAAEKEGK